MIDPAFPHQRRHVTVLALLYAFRMLGLFMVLPVLVLYADQYEHSTPFLMGVALGAYGCSQALLQIPFGAWSDRWGRRPVIAAGLIIFALGSVVAATADSVYGLILGRFLQGAGAIASALMAMVADLTSDESRTKAMAGIGAAIGLSFSLALVLGPVVSNWSGIAGIFWLTAGLAGLGLLILLFVLPEPERHGGAKLSNKVLFLEALRDRNLLRLDWGILVLHFVLMANFVVLPVLLTEVAGVAGDSHWRLYLPLLVGAFVAMLPFMIVAEKTGRVKLVFAAAVGLLGLMQIVLAAGFRHPTVLLACLFFFFMAFNLLEANLPSMVSKFVRSGMRGTANGIYSTSQFAGAFLGGSVGGAMLGWAGPAAVFASCAVLTALWLISTRGMATPRKMTSIMVSLGGQEQEQVLNKLLNLPGVAEVDWLEREQAVRLTVDKAVFRYESIAELELQ